jgi:hypothetical protein
VVGWTPGLFVAAAAVGFVEAAGAVEAAVAAAEDGAAAVVPIIFSAEGFMFDSVISPVCASLPEVPKRKTESTATADAMTTTAAIINTRLCLVKNSKNKFKCFTLYS